MLWDVSKKRSIDGLVPLAPPGFPRWKYFYEGQTGIHVVEKVSISRTGCDLEITRCSGMSSLEAV